MDAILRLQRSVISRFRFVRPESEQNSDEWRAFQFEQLVVQHQASISRVAFRLTGDRDEAEDLIQVSLIEAFEAFHRYTVGTHFDRWVFRIMRNTYLDLVRKRRKHNVESLENHARMRISGGMTEHSNTVTESADSGLMARTLDGPVQEALDSLPADFRLVIVLADIEGLSYEEVSKIVGCPVGTVRSRLHRGRSILKSKLVAYQR